MNYSIAIIGSGMSGISIAKMLAVDNNVTVFEQRNSIGGLIHCDRVNGILYHRVGGHVFNSKNKEVLNWFWNFFNKEEFLSTKRLAKVLFNKKLIGYPIEDHLFEFDAQTAEAVINDLLSGKTSQVKHATNFEDFLKVNFGETLYNLYFKPYNKKIWNVDLSEVPLEWLDGKLPMPNIKAIFVNNILREEEEGMVHATFFYPKQGGSQFLIERLAQGLTIQTTFKLNHVTVANNKLKLNSSGDFDKMVYTGDIRELPEILKNVVDLSAFESRLKTLKSNGTTNILCECDANNLSWLYVPEEQYKAHRIIYTGNFSPTNNNNNGRSSCTVEFSNYIAIDEAKEELKKLPGNLTFVAANYEPNSYVIQNTDTRKLIAELKQVLAKYNIYLLGRFAEWEYYNMDKCIEASMALKQTLLQ